MSQTVKIPPEILSVNVLSPLADMFLGTNQQQC